MAAPALIGACGAGTILLHWIRDVPVSDITARPKISAVLDLAPARGLLGQGSRSRYV